MVSKSWYFQSRVPSETDNKIAW